MTNTPHPSPIEHFSPGWFAAVMGTGVFALTTLALARQESALMPLAWGLHLLNNLLFLCLLPLWCLRWLRYRAAAWQALLHPVQANFYPTLSIALMILAAQWRVFAGQPGLALGLWWCGALLHLAFSLLIPFLMFRGERVSLEHVTPANFIPAVGLIVMPMTGMPLLPHLSGMAYEGALALNLIGLGAGSLMYVGLFGLTLFRKYLHAPAQGALTPTVWIHLAPIGVLPVSLAATVEQLPLPGLAEFVRLLALMFWGAGCWWLLMASLMTLAARRAGQLPFALSWWGFTFPLGAFVQAGLRLHGELGWGSLWAVAVLTWSLLCFFWALTALHTLQALRRGEPL